MSPNVWFNYLVNKEYIFVLIKKLNCLHMLVVQNEEITLTAAKLIRYRESLCNQ